MAYFDAVKQHLTELGLEFSVTDEHEEVLIVNDSQRGIRHLMLDCEDSLLVLEQFICTLANPKDPENLLSLLQMNRSLIHGAFAVDDSGEKVIFRDTLQLANLDLNELDASISALGLGLAENATKLISIAKR